MVKPHLHDDKIIVDDRGFFRKPWSFMECLKCAQQFEPKEFFYSSSKFSTIRGFHYQVFPKQLNRIVIVLEGEIEDVIFDISRKDRKFDTNFLTPESGSLFVPSNFAHGFRVLSKIAVVAYLTDQVYTPELERGIHYSVYKPWEKMPTIVSSRDEKAPK